MESRSQSKKSGISVESHVAERPKSLYNEKRKLRSLIDAKLRYQGQFSGVWYEWPRAGSIVDVDAADADILLTKRIGSQGCCGGGGTGNTVFDELI